MTKRMISATDQYFNALSNINLDDFLACFNKDATLDDPYGGKPFVGGEGLKKWFDGFKRTWNDFSIEAEEAFYSGDRAAVKWAARGATNSGKNANFSGIDIFTIDENGLITRMDGYWDAPSMLAQIR
jgi:steroid delta-isomerase